MKHLARRNCGFVSHWQGETEATSFRGKPRDRGVEEMRKGLCGSGTH